MRRLLLPILACLSACAETAGGISAPAAGAAEIHTRAFLCPTEESEQVFCDENGARITGIRRSALSKGGRIDDTIEDGIRTYSRRYNVLGNLVEEYAIADGTRVENPITYYDNGFVKKSDMRIRNDDGSYDRELKLFDEDGIPIYELKEIDAGTLGEFRRETFTNTSMGWLRSIANGHHMFDQEAVYYNARGERPTGKVIIYNEKDEAWQEFLLRAGFVDGQKMVIEDNRITDGMYRRGHMYKETSYYTKDENGNGLPVTFPDDSDTRVEYDKEELSVYANGTKSILYIDGGIIMGRCFGNRMENDIESFYGGALLENMNKNGGAFKCPFDEE
jgi:hypothetical protein